MSVLCALVLVVLFVSGCNTPFSESREPDIAYENVDVERMVKNVSGVSEDSIARAFGEKSPSEKKAEIMLASARTFEEVRGVFWYAPHGTEVEKAAEKKIVSFLPDMLASATTAEKVAAVLRYAPEGSELKKMMRTKFKFLFEQELASATTFEKVEELYEMLQNAEESDSEAGRAALAKIDSLLPDVITSATTFEKIGAVLRFSKKGSETEKAAWEKMDSLLASKLASAKTIEKLEEIVGEFSSEQWRLNVLHWQKGKEWNDKIIRAYAEFFPKKKK